MMVLNFYSRRVSPQPPVTLWPLYVSSTHLTQIQQEAKPVSFPLTSVHGGFQVASFGGCYQTVLP